jgi:very-short-patch-repair endonuclease
MEALPIAAWRQWWRCRWLDCGDEPLAAAAREQGFVVTSAQARSLGWTNNDIRRQLRRQVWWSPARGVLSPLDVSDDKLPYATARRRAALVATGAAMLRPGQVITGRSGAVLHGFPTFALPDLPQLSARAPATLGNRTRTHVYSAALLQRDITTWFGAHVANPQRVLVDLARHDRRDAIMAADAALREEAVTWEQLAASLADAAGWPYARQARELLALADPRSESPLESVVRLALHDDGFPPPEPQAWIGPYRVDFYWPQYRFVLEADGRGKYDEVGDPLWDEKRRETAISRTGVQVERVLWSDVARTADWIRFSSYLRRKLRTASSPV